MKLEILIRTVMLNQLGQDPCGNHTYLWHGNAHSSRNNFLKGSCLVVSLVTYVNGEQCRFWIHFLDLSPGHIILFLSNQLSDSWFRWRFGTAWSLAFISGVRKKNRVISFGVIDRACRYSGGVSPPRTVCSPPGGFPLKEEDCTEVQSCFLGEKKCTGLEMMFVWSRECSKCQKSTQLVREI